MQSATIITLVLCFNKTVSYALYMQYCHQDALLKAETELKATVVSI